MAFPSQGLPIDAQDLNENWIPVRPSTQQVDWYSAAVAYGKPLTNISICEWYTDGCPNTSTFPYNIGSYQSDIIGEQVTTYWTHAGALPFTLASYTIWMKVDYGGTWSVRISGLSSSLDQWTDTSTQPGRDIYTRVQAIGTGGEKSPLDVDMDNSTITPLPIYPPFALTTTEDLTPTTV